MCDMESREGACMRKLMVDTLVVAKVCHEVNRAYCFGIGDATASLNGMKRLSGSVRAR